MTGRILGTAFIGVLAACGADMTTEEVATTDHAIHAWGTYHWARTANPAPLALYDSVTSDWDAEFETTRVDWSASSVLSLTTVASSDSVKTRKRCTSVSGAIRVCNSAYGFNGWLGLAQIWIDPQGHIERGTAKMNDSYSSYWTPEEKNHVMCQEVGHAFGLGHQSETGEALGTCMDYSSDPGSQYPDAHDYEMLEEIYAHLDSYNSYNDGSDIGGKCRGKKCAAGADAGNWGFLLHGNNHVELYERTFPDGSRLVTHLRLAD